MATLTNKDRSILGPLTTTFTPPAPCTIAIGLCETCNVAWWGQTCAPDAIKDNASCWPATTEGAPAAQSAFYGWGFYSPGLECPVGYTSACTAIDGESSEWKVQFQMEAQETFVGCCPTGFNCHNQNGQTCIRKVASTSLPMAYCQDGSSNNFGFTTLPNDKVKSMWLYAPMIQLAWQSSDLPTTTTTISSSTSTLLGSAVTSVPSPDSSSSSSTITNTTSSDGLSTGAVAGIAVGAALLFLFILAAALFVWRRKRAAAQGGQHAALSDAGGSSIPPAYSDAGYDSAELAAKYYYTGNLAEATSTPGVYEVSGQVHGKVELSGDNLGPVEMPSYGRGAGAVEMPVERYH